MQWPSTVTSQAAYVGEGVLDGETQSIQSVCLYLITSAIANTGDEEGKWYVEVSKEKETK